MLSDKDLERLVPHLKQYLPKNQYHKIGELVEKVYLYDYNGELKTYSMGFSSEESPFLCFDIRTYSFVGVASPDHVKKHGELI